MITHCHTSKKSFSKNKPNLIEKYIACKTIKTRSRPSQLNMQQRMLFTQISPNQNHSYMKFKQNHCEKPVQMRVQKKKHTNRQPERIFLKEDLIKLGKINQDRIERKVTKISLLLKKLVNQQLQSQKSKMENNSQSIDANNSVNQTRNKTIKNKGQQKVDSLRLKSNLHLKQIQEGLMNLKSEHERENSIHKFLTARSNHIRYASTASRFKTNYRIIQKNCFQTLKIHRCTRTKMSWQLEGKEQKTIVEKSGWQQKKSRDQLRLEVTDCENLESKRSERHRKLPKMPTQIKSQSHNQTIEPWTHHQIPLNDAIQISEQKRDVMSHF